MAIDLEALTTLDTVIRAGSFAAAAQRLHRSQSVISHRLRKLERQLGVELLDRSAYRVTLTPAGVAMLAEGRRLLAEAQRVGTLARQLSEGWEARLLMIVDGVLPLQPTLMALKTIAAEQIPTRIQVKVEFLNGVQYRFEKEAADLMLVKDYRPLDYFDVHPLPETEVVLCAAATHPLAAQPRVSLRELQEHVELSIQDSSERGDDRHMFGGERVFYLSDFVTKREALRMGLGFGWMPLYLVQAELRRGALREVRYQGGSRYRFTPALIHRRNQPLGRAGQRLVELLRGAPVPAPTCGLSGKRRRGG
jgi:DNA-binding transcriptional LysR family regulator